MVRDGGVKKKNGHASTSKGKGPVQAVQSAPKKGKAKGKGKKVKPNKARTENRCFTCNEVGHWRQNCPKRHEAGASLGPCNQGGIANLHKWEWVDRLSGLEQRADDVAKEFDEFLEGVIEEHLSKNVADDKGQDIVDILLEIQKTNTTGFTFERDLIKAITMDVFAGGTYTTFTNLEWAMTELRHPQAMKKMQQETQEIGQGRSMISEDDLYKMPYLRAIIKETLRLHPPLPLLIPHESTQDVKVLGYDIAAGTQVIVNAWAIGRDSSTWADPNEFQPERFLNSPIDYKGFHFELIPFGVGRRGCPGIHFAMIINELVFANLVYKFDFALDRRESLDMSETLGLTAQKKCPLLVTVTSCK
ncbi:hypothetical protein OSB04_003875 [Centaurea solstitialis]|uniref:CCHC-type domain-containing protein n=1 Tax=Centaurea solstitialis TaxID=347529 RepID=A0AA38TXI5_9ASTR|nr:hypothetical protein OSB04_003875 [Centaurea solstitialis]